MTRILGQGRTRVPVTRLSRSVHDLCSIAGVLRLARRSLLLLSMLLVVQSCIVADPPEYRAPVQTRPVLNVYSAQPPTTKVLPVYTAKAGSAENVLFSVPIQSEDAGEALRSLLFLDYGTPGELKLNGQNIPPSTYEDTSRTTTLTWVPKADAGCHFVTLIVAHTSTFQSIGEDHLDPGKADDDAALLTWTVNVDPTDNVNTLPNCPSSVATVQ